MTRLERLHDAGVSIWLDTLSRELLDSGALATLIADYSVTGALTVVGWPLKACRDALRDAQLFRRVALADFLGYFTMAGLSIALAVSDAPLWLLIAVGGAVPLFIGLAAGAIFAFARALGLRAPFILGGVVLAMLAVVSARVLTTTAVEEARALASGDVA